MNPKTVGIFGAAGALCAVAIFLVVQQISGPTPQPPRPDPRPVPVPVPVVGTPDSDVTFGSRVRAHAMLSQSYLMQGSSNDVYLNVDLTPANIAGTRAPFAAAIVIDRSGSMAGAKIDNAQDAALAFLKNMRDDDQITIVTYGSDVTVNLRLAHVGNVRSTAQRIIRGIDAGGGTNIAGGLRSAISQLATANGPRRVVLISDGRPTEGERRPPMLASIAAEGREQGLSFTSIGVGIDYDENVMENIALRGGGSFYHLRQFAMLAGIMTKEFQSVDTIVASDIRLRIDPGSNVSVEEVYGYDFSREGSSVVVRVGDISRGTQLRVVARSRVNAGSPAVARFAGLGLGYRIPDTGAGESATASLTFASTPDIAIASGSQKVDVVVNSNKVAAASIMRQSMEQMASGQRAEGVASLKRAKAQLDTAASMAPAAAAPALKQEAERYNDLGAKAGAVQLDSADGQDFVKSNRAAAFSEQQGR